ncbi:MAG: BatA domain-containing protein, partial [Planctomycetota bacterium]
MTAGAAMFLTLLPLAGVPVIFHLLMRRKRKDYVFSTRMFFHKIDPRMRSRRRIQELLLLLSRVLLIALVLLTLSRLWIDTVRDVFGLGEQQMVVLIIDNSGSMNTKMPDGNSTKLQTAKESAQVLLSHLDEDAKAAVLTL